MTPSKTHRSLIYSGLFGQDTAPVAPVPATVLIDEIMAHLGAAKMQLIPTDDQIIAEHIRAAHDLVRILRRAQ